MSDEDKNNCIVCGLPMNVLNYQLGTWSLSIKTPLTDTEKTLWLHVQCACRLRDKIIQVLGTK